MTQHLVYFNNQLIITVTLQEKKTRGNETRRSERKQWNKEGSKEGNNTGGNETRVQGGNKTWS